MSNRGTEQAVAAKSILRGTFESFSLADVFGALALSRQLLGIHFSDEKRQVGSILVKAGQVVGAEDFRTPCRGAAALDGLVSNPGTAFSVVRVPRAALETPVVIGRLGDLLASAVGGRRRAPTAAPESRTPSTSAEFFFPNDTFDPPESLFEAPISAPSGEHDSVPGAQSDIDSSRLSSDGVPSSRIGEVIMLGDVGDASFGEILEVLELSDQHLLILFSRGDSEVGALRLMSGQVLAVTAGPERGMAAFRKLHADHGDVFEVRRLIGPGLTKGIGGVTELLAGMRQANPPVAPGRKPPGGRALFMRGALSDFPLEVLIGSLELSRQPIELVLRRGEQVLHRVMARAGRITSVASVRGEGTDSGLAAIREDPGTQFLVYRNTNSGVGQSVASLEALVSDTGAIPDSAGEYSAARAAPVDPVAVQSVSGPREVEAGRDDLSGIEARLQQITADIAALRVASRNQRRDSAQPELARAMSRIATAEERLRLALVGVENARTDTVQELRAELAATVPGRRERFVLKCIPALQFVTLAVAVGALIVAF